MNDDSQACMLCTVQRFVIKCQELFAFDLILLYLSL